jgi:hypothetical protein
MLASYHFFIIIIALLAAYGLSYLLVINCKLPLIKHRRLWNYLLLATFAISGLLGLVLTFLIDYKFSIAWYREFLWLHVEFGVAMAVIAIIHIIWHWRYFWRKR